MWDLLGRTDSFESFLEECFDLYTSSSHNNASTGSACNSMVESAVDFDLSLLGQVDEGESVAETAPVDVSCGAPLCRDSMKLRASEIEDLLGVHQFAFWRASTSAAIPLIVSLCFILVRELDRRQFGVLLRVPTVVLKRQILAAKDIFKLRGYFVDLA